MHINKKISFENRLNSIQDSENSMSAITKSKNGYMLHIRVSPMANVSVVKEVTPDFIKIAIKAPPVDNKANKELIKFIAKKLKLPKSKILIKSGTNSKNKVLEILETAEIDFNGVF